MPELFFRAFYLFLSLMEKIELPAGNMIHRAHTRTNEAGLQIETRKPKRIMITSLSYRLTTLVLLCSFILPASAQGTLVTGVITDNRNVPIVGARACQAGTANCTAADMDGVFHLMLEPDKDQNLNVTCPGFNPVEIVIDNTTSFPVRISMIPIYYPEGGYVNETDHDNPDGLIGRSSLGFDFIFSDFSEFSELLGTYNTEVMEFITVTGPEVGISFPRFYTGFGFEFGYGYEDDHDSLVVDLNNTLYKLTFGYDIINSRRIRMTPMLSFRWLTWRLRNYPDERRVPLERYLLDREIDLRFNQTAAVAGLNLEYKIYSDVAGLGDYWSLGLYGGYAMRLNHKPWIWSDGNRITTDRAIGLDPLTVGFSISFYNIAQ